MIATSTASGKSLCYVIPILETLLTTATATAILIYPTKALAQDQRNAIRRLLLATMAGSGREVDAEAMVQIYDGDTPQHERKDVLEKAQIILTNPDMLHVSILPVHASSPPLARIFSNLKYVVVDEAHTLKGIFGCHTALVLRRLRRICARVYHNDQLAYAVTTATVANPSQHACKLLGVEAVTLVDGDGSPCGSKQFVLWNPPLRKHTSENGDDEKEKDGRRTNGGGGGGGGKLVQKREAQEAVRAALRAARQERCTGVKLTSRHVVIEGEVEGNKQEEEGEEEEEEKVWEEAVGIGVRDIVVRQRYNAQSSPEKAKNVSLSKKDEALVVQATAALSATISRPQTAEVSSISRHRTGPLSKPIVIGDVTCLPLPLPTNVATMTTKSKTRGRIGTAGVAVEEQRSSPIVETASLLAEAVQHNLRTIAFCKTRKLAELVIAYVREILSVTAPHLSTRVAVYRSGYSAVERREIEAALGSGALMGVAATNALELGIDIGGLDCTLHLGFPGSIASLYQQAGRAGRREQPSVSVYVGWEGPLDQYFLKNPEKLFGRPIEAALVDVVNGSALDGHVTCAALECPLSVDLDAPYFGVGVARGGEQLEQPPRQQPGSEPFHKSLQRLQSSGILGRNLMYIGPDTSPASKITLRAIDPGRYVIIDEFTGKELEQVEENKAFYQVYDGGTYFFQGRTYLCVKLDLDSKVALVRPASNIKYYTRPVDFTAVQVIGGAEHSFITYPPTQNGGSTEQQQHQCSTQHPVVCSRATVTTRWLHFVRIWRGTGEVFDSVDLFLPDVCYETEACYLRLPPSVRRTVESQGLSFREGVHAASHAILNILPLYIMANPQDVGCECDNPYDTRYKVERLLIYDKHPGGGMGLSAAARPVFLELMKKALDVVTGCGCTHGGGCPGCVQHTECGEYNSVLNKRAGKLVLETALQCALYDM